MRRVSLPPRRRFGHGQQLNMRMPSAVRPCHLIKERHTKSTQTTKREKIAAALGRTQDVAGVFVSVLASGKDLHCGTSSGLQQADAMHRPGRRCSWLVRSLEGAEVTPSPSAAAMRAHIARLRLKAWPIGPTDSTVFGAFGAFRRQRSGIPLLLPTSRAQPVHWVHW